MGHVYRAWDARLHREVAVKLLNHDFAMPGMRERFLREARAASALTHANICTIFDIGEQDGDPYLVMELLRGETLKDRILGRTLQVEEIVAIARDTAEALGAAHSKGIVHRDVKPANIFLVEKPNGGIQAKVLDFGLAKFEGGVLGARGRSLDLTTAGATVGTLAYMSPEQARGEPLDARSDLFSLGVAMYEMATRQVPFQGATSALVFVQLLHHAPEPVRDWNEAIPRELEKIIFKLLAKDRAARYQTARELEAALQAVTERGGGGGGWLRRATVPLARVPNSGASRGKRAKGGFEQDSNARMETAKPVTPHPPSSDSPRPPSSGEQVLRPVRFPRGEGAGLAARNTPAPGLRREASPSPLPPGYVPPSMRGVHLRGASANAGPREKEAAEEAALHPRRTEETVPSGQTATLKALEDSGGTPEPGSVSGSPSNSAFAWENAREEDSIAVDVDAESEDRWSGGRHQHATALVLGGLALAAVAGAYPFFFQHRFGASLLAKSDVVAVTEFQNETGDRSLDSSVAEALRLDLAQSPYFSFRGGDSYWAARRLAGDGPEPGRKTAEMLAAKAYLTGTVSASGNGYQLHVELRDVGTNRALTTLDERAESLQQIPDAIGQMASELRSAAGEPRSSVERSHVALAQEASGNLAAIQLYSQGEAEIASQQPVAALADLEQAVALDPKFIEGQMRLALLYGELRAETSAAESARLAVAAADGAGERTRTLAQAIYELEATGDYAKAASLLRHLVSIYPNDPEALALLARALNLEGHVAEALPLAQQAYTADALNGAAYSEAEFALLGLDRFDAAFQLDAQAQRMGVARPADSLTVAYLDGRQDTVDTMISSLPVGKMEYRPDWSYGLYLDNAGRMAAGAALWLTRADAAVRADSLRSAAAFLLSQGALDRALLSDCGGALLLLHQAEQYPKLPYGRQALFKSGLARALCGDTLQATQIVSQLQERYPNSFEGNGFYMADIQAANALNRGNPATAIQVLQATHAFDTISLTPYLLGRANRDLHQPAIGIVDFQTELSHRGLAFLFGSDVVPASQIELARSFAQSGDAANSAEAYRRFLKLWALADPAEPLLAEAASHGGTP